jgi:transcription-repair coupling factor (superfamily II helicase)
MKLPGHSITDLVETIRNAHGLVNCTGLSGSERAYVIDRLREGLNRPICIVCTTNKEMERLRDDYIFFASLNKKTAVTLPPYDILPFKPLSYRAETSCRRIGALYTMMTATEAPIVFTAVGALMQKVIPKEVLSQFVDFLVAGEEADRDGFIRKLIQGGYQESLLVEEPGDFAVRGALVDLYPPLYEDPVRIEFFGDQIESIRTFGAQDQLSLKQLSEVTILPAVETVLPAAQIESMAERVRCRGESLEMPGLRLQEIIEKILNQEQFPGIGGLLTLLHPLASSLFDYVPGRTLFVLADAPAVEKTATELEESLKDHYVSAEQEGHLCVEPESLFFPWSQTKEALQKNVHLAFSTVLTQEGTTDTCSFVVEDNFLVSQQLKARPDPEALFKPLTQWIGRTWTNGLATYLVCRTVKQAKRLEEMLATYGLDLEHAETFTLYRNKRKATLCIGNLEKGFVWAREGIALITEEEIFGPRHYLLKAAKKKAKTAWLAFEDLKTGDLVVHEDHGVGQYGGLIKLDVGQVTNDFLLIEYRDGDKLYVPADRMNCVQKYVGVDGVTPLLDKMGGKSWGRIKERVKKSIRKMAGMLLKLYAQRKIQNGHAFSASDPHFHQFEAAFEYTETPDQGRAVEDVLKDMESCVPMDRLICGDVGYGKTEIALRAAFKAVWDHKQVAFLVPTTVLAEQHYQTFKNRFEPYPVQIETLSRFKPLSEQKSAIQKLKEGKADIVIGTHRLLQKDVHFKDLGLVIVDEEQRFGVAHKEKLKQLCQTVDYLALTATPIPRTLHMSLMGIRDLSVIASPPEYRYPIKTYISTLNDTVIAEALHRELQRGGQIFFVHNHIQTIHAMTRRLRELIPHLRVGVAHGQLEDDELEKVMLRFLHREIDCLVCTTIIESGLDFSSANTILINRADKFGLSQIYQLRGRVGRSDEQAYAYLFIPHENALTRDAQKRLKVLMEHSDLGSGFQIAMSDLQIRGGGTILGPTQSGQIASVGHDMYLQLMERTIAELKGEAVPPKLEPEIVADLSASIPERYISPIDQRMVFYRRLAKAANEEEISEIRDELIDRFGPLPDEVTTLLEKISVKVLCQELGVQRIEVGARSVVLTFSDQTRVTPEKIMALAQVNPKRFRLLSDYTMQARFAADPAPKPMDGAKKVLQEIVS